MHLLPWNSPRQLARQHQQHHQGMFKKHLEVLNDAQLIRRCLSTQPRRRLPLRKCQLNSSTTRHSSTSTCVQAGQSVLAIETSCDDSSVAVLSLEGHQFAAGRSKCEDKQHIPQQLRSTVNFHETVTASSHQYNGIHPIVALESHHMTVANLVQSACQHMRKADPEWKPTLVAATRGPGMRSNLAVGLSVAKGLAVAWNRPFLGVHHMQAHALTPRVCWTLQDEGNIIHQPSKTWTLDSLEPFFPYLTVLASGGHTMLLQSADLCEHQILAETQDIAIGDCLDKAARAIVPSEFCKPPYGRALELFAFPNGEADYNYVAPRTRKDELREHLTAWSWSFRMPLQNKSGEKTDRRMEYSFSGMLTQTERHMRKGDVGLDERRDMAREVLRIAFEHLASRILLHLSESTTPVKTVVVSGGVASNKFLRHVLRQMLDARGYGHIATVFPPVELCTDNALMIAWAALEMYSAGYTSSLDVEPLRKWSMDSSEVGGGILGASGWVGGEGQ